MNSRTTATEQKGQEGERMRAGRLLCVAASVATSQLTRVLQETMRLRREFAEGGGNSEQRDRLRRRAWDGPLAELATVVIHKPELREAAADVTAWSPQELADALAACAYFDSEDVELIGALVARLAEAPQAQLTPEIIARAMSSCAVLGFVNDEMLQRLLSVGERNAAQFSGKAAGQMAVAMGRFQLEALPLFATLVGQLSRDPAATRGLSARTARELLYFLHATRGQASMRHVRKQALARSLCSIVVRRFDEFGRTRRGERVSPRELNFVHQAAGEFGLSLPWLDAALLKATRAKGVVVNHGGDTSMEDSVQCDAVAVDKVKLQALLKS